MGNEAGEMTEEGRPALEVVMAFLACGGRRDFSGARALLDRDVTRIGPDGDVKSGREEYVAYLGSVLGDVQDYRYEVRRGIVAADGLSVAVEIDEALTEANGTELAVSEVMVFDLTSERLIRRLSVYTKV
jgi:ketosteroid isomerase-like protein